MRAERRRSGAPAGENKTKGTIMINFLKGEIFQKSDGRILLEVNGVGFEILVSNSTLTTVGAEGENVLIHTSTFFSFAILFKLSETFSICFSSSSHIPIVSIP